MNPTLLASTTQGATESILSLFAVSGLSSAYLIIGLLAIAFFALPLILCPVIADRQGRNAAAWFFVAIASGWLGLIILACIGDA